MSAHWDAYRRARNSVVHVIRNAKRAFYRDAIKSNLDNPKNLWKIIRNITPSKCSNLPSHLSVDGKIVSNNTEIANLFNQHFANITSSVDLGDAPVCPNWDYFTNFVNSSSRVARRPSLYRLLQRILSSPVSIVSRSIRPLAWTRLTVTFLKLQHPLYPLR